MNSNYTRRSFLKTSLAGSALVAGSRALGASGFVSIDQLMAPASVFSADERGALRLAIDEIIPAGHGMPAASEAGVLEYLERSARELPKLRRELAEMLGLIEDSSRRFQQSFANLTGSQRVQSLSAVEKQAGAAFADFRDWIYEAYYTRPEVWKLLGYKFYSSHGPGPEMLPFNEAALEKVKKMGKLYVEVE